MRNVARLIVCLLSISFLTGCGPKITPMAEMVTVNGKLSDASGASVGSVVLTFQPLENGHMAPLQVAQDGTFSGKLVPGKYAYFVKKGEAPESEDVIGKLDPKFQEATMTRTITVQPGQDLNVVLN